MQATPENQPGLIAAAKETYAEFSKDDVMTQAAALAFYTGLSLAPVLTVAVWIARFFFRDNDSKQLENAFTSAMGPQAAKPMIELLSPASSQIPQGMTTAGIISIVLIIVSASGVFGQLQAALNTIWGVKQDASSGIKAMIMKRLLSFGMLLSILFVLLLSVVATTTIQAVVKKGATEEASGVLMIVLENVLSLAIFAGLFAAMFRYLPDVRIEWRHVWVGGILSAVMFLLGKIGLGLYLGRGSFENQYGAAVGGFVALLVWFYYSAIILLIGAEITQVYARRRGGRIQPDEHAVRVIKRTETVAT